MKTTNLFLSIIFSLAISGSLFANSDHDPNANITFEAGIQPTKMDAVIFRYINNVYDKLLVKVYDEEGTLLHSKTVTTKGNIKLTYKISDLPSGDYTIKVFHKRKAICSKKFNLTTDKIIHIECN